MKSFLWLLLGLFAFSSVTAVAQMPPLPGDSVYQLPARLSDQRGGELAWGDLSGRVRLVSMFYTGCHVMCPLIIENGKAIQKQLPAADAARIDLVVVSMDPVRDTPAALSEVMTRHKLEQARWTLLRPKTDEVRSIAGLLDIRYRPLADGGFDHTSAWILLDPEGRILARSEVTGVAPDPAFVEKVRQVVAANR